MPQSGKYTIKEFATQIKAQHPDYATWDDMYLAREVVSKYPEYKEWIDVEIPQQPAHGVEPESGLDIAKNQIRKMGRGFFESFGGDPDSPIFGTAKNLVGGTLNTVKNIGTAMAQRPSEGVGGALVRAVGAPMAQGVVAGPREAVSGLVEGDAGKVAHGVGQTVGTGVQLLSPGTKAGRRISNTVADLPMKAPKVAGRVADMAGGVPVRPEKAMMKAIKPYVRKTDFYENLNRSMPELKASEAELGRPIKTIDDVLDGVKVAKKRVWGQYEAIKGPQAGKEVSLANVADAMESSVSKKALLENPKLADAIKEQADIYRRPFSIADIDELLTTTNAELEAYYNKYPGARRGAVEKNPETAILTAQAKELRSALYGALDEAGGGAAPRELKKRYGTLMELEQEAFRRKNVAARQAPESLTEQLGKVGAAMKIGKAVVRGATGDFAGAAGNLAEAYAGRKMAGAIKQRNTTDYLIESSMKRYDKLPTPVKVEPRPARPAPKQITSGAIVTPAPNDASYVKGVPADLARREIKGLLPEPKKPATRLPALDTTSIEIVDARRGIARDPKTGRLFRYYTSDRK